MRPLLILAALASPAAAQPGLVTPEPAVEHEWYGYWTFGADAASIALGVATENPVIGAGGYLIGAPIVHLYKRNYLGAGLSLGTRLGLPFLLAMWGRHDDERESSGSGHVDETSYGISGEAAGIILGVIGASLLDGFLYARRTVVADPAPSWTLGVTARDGVAVSLGGRW